MIKKTKPEKIRHLIKFLSSTESEATDFETVHVNETINKCILDQEKQKIVFNGLQYFH